MTSLRPYQQDAINSVFDFWGSGGGNPLVEMATGTGKSVVIADLARQVCQYPSLRVLMLVHVRCPRRRHPRRGHRLQARAA